MPGGHSASSAEGASAWGTLPLVVDTSAWARAGLEDVRDRWREALRADRLRVFPIVRLELLLTARGGVTFDEMVEELSAMREARLSATVVDAAEDAMRTLAHRSAGAQRLPVVDYLVAAAAQEIGAAVLHYDHDFDTLAEVMGFESIWLAEPGSLP